MRFLKGLVKNDQKLLPASVFKKTRSIFGRPKISARLSPILSMDPGCKNGLRDAFFKRRASRNFWSFFTTPLKCFPILFAFTWIDLTHPFDANTIYWPTAEGFKLQVVHKGKTEKGYWYETNYISASEHGGTHMDAPVHFAKGRWTTDQIPLNRLIGHASVLDVSAQTKKNRDYLILVGDLERWEKEHGVIPAGSLFLVNTGWSKFWPNKKKYLGTDKKGDVAGLHFPGYSKEAAEFLVKRKVTAVGLDTPSVDFGQSKTFEAHQAFGKANIPAFENVAHLHKLPATGAIVYALPMKIGGGSGGPLRIIATIP